MSYKDYEDSRQERIAEMKKNLIQLKNNVYIHPNDPLYHEKLIKFVDNRKQGESHYYLGMKYERIGNKKRAIHHFEKAIQLGTPNKSAAEEALLLLRKREQEKKINAKPLNHKSMLLKSLIISLLLLNVVLIFLLFQLKGNDAAFAEERNASSIEIQYIELPKTDDLQELETALYEETVNLATKLEAKQLHVVGYHDSQLEPLIIATYDATSSPKLVFTYKNKAVLDEKLLARKDTVVATNIVRTALQAYLMQNGTLPEELSSLARDYPNNYLSYIPNEPESMSNKVSQVFNGQGGWVYDRNGSSVEAMFYPNIYEKFSNNDVKVKATIPYEPITIMIAKEDHLLQVKNGDFLLAEMPVGLGKEGRTPLGSFAVSERVLNPLGTKPNIYGSAGLALGTIAIHGTDNRASIGENYSLGCIRMNNEDITEIFPLVPLYSEVTIVEHMAQSDPLQLLSENFASAIKPQQIDTITETTKELFYWLH